MVEGTPGLPYGSDGQLLPSLCEIEDSMKFRRQEVQRVLEPDETVMTITSFPRLGCPNFTHPLCNPKPETSASGSLFFPDEAIFGGHPRFKTLVKNIRSRRRRKVIINLPIFRDTHTPDPFYECFADEEARSAAKPNYVYMDAMGFGMGCCCLQLTLQATHLEEAKVLYDQLAPITPIALALSAASPVFRGYLTDRDCRWDAISSSVDDRTREESGETRELKEAPFRIPKSRYDSISCYLSRHGQKYNDLPIVFDKNYYDVMVANKVEPAVARHIAHLFIRDPITLYKEKLDQNDTELDHFENIQSTNWQTMRFKPPPAVHSPIGWRVEFRPLEAQTSDFENAAFVVFITLLSRVILEYKLNFLMPISLVDKNMIEAQKRDAVKESKFWFRTDIMHRSSPKEPLSTVLENCCNSTNNGYNRLPGFRNFSQNHHRHNQQHEGHRATKTAHQDTASKDIGSCATQMTINEIINGKEGFIGIMPIIWHYVESLDDGSNTEFILKIKRYLKLISDRASLKVKTTARMMRDFIDSHPKYAHDSMVNDEVAYDLLKMMDKIGKSEFICTSLVGEPSSSLDTHQSVRDTSLSNGHQSNHVAGVASFNSFGNDAIARRSLCNRFNWSRKSPSGRVSKSSSSDKHSEHYSRSMSR